MLQDDLGKYLEPAVEQAPILVITLVALIFIVRSFLVHINESTDRQEKRDEARDNLDLARAQSLAKVGDECHAVQREATEVMSAVRITLEQNTEVLRQNALCFQEVSLTHRQLLEKLRDS